MFGAEEFLDILGLQEQASVPIQAMCQSLLSSLCSPEARGLRKSPPGDLATLAAPVWSLLDKLEAMCKCWLHLLAVQPEVSDVETSAKHVLLFTSFSGKAGFERNIKNLLHAENTFWCKEAQEVVRTASKTLLAQEKSNELKGLLEQKLSVEVLAQSLRVFQELKEALRATEVRKFAQALSERFQVAANSLMGDADSCFLLSSKTVDVILEGLTMFEASEGIPTVKAELRTWMTAQMQSIRHGDVWRLLQFLSREQVSPQDLKFDKIAKVVAQVTNQKCPPVDRSPEYYEVAHCAFRKLLLSLTHQDPPVVGCVCLLR